MVKLIVLVDYPTDHFISNMLRLTHGTDTEIIDISKVVFPDAEISYSPLSFKCIRLTDRAQVLNYIKALHDVFVLWHVSFTYQSLDLFQAMPKQATFIYPLINNVPTIDYTIQKLKGFRQIQYLNSILYKLPLWVVGVRQPDVVLWDGRKTLEEGSRFAGKNTKLINIHSYPSDSYILSQPKLKEKHIVFIDENIPSHPDNIIFDTPTNINPDAYYSKMNKLFDALKLKYQCPVIIACHPKSSESEMQLLFPGRTVLKGQTDMLVRDAKLVIGHASTALSIAVLMNKPILLITTNQINTNLNISMQINGYKKQLGLKLINIDNSIIDYSTYIDIEKYNNFIENYIWNRKDYRSNNEILKDFLYIYSEE